MLQENNPNYLKASPSRRIDGEDDMKETYDDIDEIPIAELSLDVPLKVHCKREFDILISTIIYRLFKISQKTI